jgi:gamma-glutamyltranspeptidase/glutathione hydrolase
MVTAQEPIATDVGVATLKAGGNAVDAAVAVAFALAVTHPSAGNIGGGGFMLVRMADGRTTFFDFREMAPQASSRNMYIGADGKPTDDSVSGWRASGIPGTVRGLEAAHKKLGSKPWATLVTPAAELAERGIELSYAEARSMCGSKKTMEPYAESKRIFLKNGACFEPGETLKQPELGRVLRRIAAEGARDFYEGETARILVEEMKKNGGLVTAADLKGYRVAERQPLKGEYRNYTVFTAPPPSSGGIGILQMLKMLDGTGYEKAGVGSAASTHFIAEVERRYFADRSRYLGDADFVKVPIAGMLDPAYIAQRRASIDPEHVTPSTALGAGEPKGEPTETTHFNVVDAAGNAVALTYTLNNSYGSGVTVPRLGILMNDEMDDFAAQPGGANMFGLIQGEANAIAPGKRPLSAMLKDGKLFLVLGAPGGPRIISGVLEVLLHVVDFGLNVQRAVDQPRLHHQWMPDELSLEPGFSPDTRALLERRGHKLKNVGSVGSVEAIEVEAPRFGTAWLAGAQNGRSAGKAAGY